MQVAYTSEKGHQLPDSMSYGFIDPQSIVESDKQLTAHYVTQITQKLVHKITRSETGCKV